MGKDLSPEQKLKEFVGIRPGRSSLAPRWV